MSTFLLLLLLIATPTTLLSRSHSFAYADDSDEDTSENAEAVVEDEDEDEDDEEEQPNAVTEEDVEALDGDAVTASSDADVKIVFPEHQNLDFPAGSVVTALIGFHNKGQSAFTVQSIEGSLRHLQDFSFFIQNFTVEVIDKEIKSFEHATFLYRFTPHESFDPRDFGFQLNVNYINSDEAPFRHTVFNGTIHIVDSDESFDTRSLFATITTLAVAVLGFLVYKQKTARVAVVKKVAKTELGTAASASSSSDNEWLANANISQRKAASPKKSTK